MVYQSSTVLKHYKVFQKKVAPLQKLVDISGYELPTNMQNFTQKDSTEVKIFQKVLERGLLF